MARRLLPRTEPELLDAIVGALADNAPLEVIGAGSKRAYGRPVQAGAVLDLSGLSGILEYEPAELMLTAWAGTPLAEIETALAERRQCLAFEPADWGPLLGAPAGRATLGGIMAANVAGPRRLSHGAARDHILGARAVSGRGALFVCGGKVVKNVTGFDLPKLLTGSLGTLAVLSRVTVKVLPAPEETRTLALSGLDLDSAIKALNAALSSRWEVSGTAYWPGRGLTLARLEGPALSVAARATALAAEWADFGQVSEADSALWTEIRDVLPFADDDRLIWRLMVPPAAAAKTVAAIAPAEFLMDRGGALAWLALEGSDPRADQIRTLAEAAGGRATLMRAPADLRAAVSPFHPEPVPLAALSARLKAGFDPQAILNPGRM